MPDLTLTDDEIAAVTELRRRGGLRQAVTALDAAVQAAVSSMRAAAAAAAGFNARVFADLCAARGLDVEVRDETRDGARVKVAYVRKAGEQNATWEPLTMYATRELGAHLPSLRHGAGDGDDVIEFPANGAGSSAQEESGSMVDDFIQRTNRSAAARPNPLRPPTRPAA